MATTPPTTLPTAPATGRPAVIPSNARTDEIAPGWPRPRYAAADGRTKPVQWITDHAASQIMSCSSDRTYTAGVRFACSCCAGLLTRGYLVDNDWIALRRGKRVDVFDTHYGSPLCARCAVFALTVCPAFFAALDREFGPDLRWVEVQCPGDYEEIDESSALRLTDDGRDCPSVTSADLREMVRVGDLGLTGQILDDSQVLRRPPDHEIDGDLL